MDKQVKKEENESSDATNSDVKKEETTRDIKSEKTDTKTEDINSASAGEASVGENEKDPLLNIFYSEVILLNFTHFFLLSIFKFIV